MATDERKVQLGVTVDATEARQGFSDVKDSARDMAQAVVTQGSAASKAIDSIGNGGAASAQKVDAAARSMIQSIQRQTAATLAGAQAGEQAAVKGTAAYYDLLAAQRGMDPAKIRPWTDSLREAEAAMSAMSSSLGGVDPAAQKFMQTLQSQATALKDQVATFGMSRTELLAYQATQLGIANDATTLIAQIEKEDAALKSLRDSAATATASVNAFGETEAEAAARIKGMVASSLEATKAMETAAMASQSAAAGVTAVGASADQVRANVLAQTQAMIDAQHATSLMTDEMQALRTVLAQGGASFETLGDQYSRLDRAMATGKLSMEDYDTALAAIGKQEDARTASLNSLTAKYDPLSAATQKLAADEALLNDAYKSGAVSADAYEKSLNGIRADQASVSLKQLAQQEAEVERAFKSGATSYADYRAALKDIASSRSALSEVAGAAESAGAAMGHFGLNTAGARTELLRLVNDLANGNFGRFDQSAMVLAEDMNVLALAATPAGVALAAVAAVAVAYGAAAMHVQSQLDDMNQAIVLTGNYAGTTVSELSQMAQAATAGGATIDTATTAVTKLAATGRLTAGEIANIGEATADASTYMGVSVDKMVGMFAELAKDPVKASAALNEQYHYLTASTFDQIDALQKQGDATGAAQIADEAFAKAVRDRSQDVRADLGYIQTAWDDIKGAITGAIHAVGSFGAAQTDAQKLQTLNDKIGKAQSSDMGFLDPTNGAGLAKMLSDRDAILSKMQSDAAAAAKQSQQDSENNAKVTAKNAYDVWKKQFWSPQQKAADELQKYLNNIATPLGLSPDQQLSDEQNIADRYKDKKTGPHSAGLIDKTELSGEVQAVKDALAEELAAVSSSQKQLDALYKGGGTSEQAYYQQTRDLIAQKYTDEIDSYNKEAALLSKGLSDSKLSAAQKAQINNQVQQDQAKASKATEDFFNAIADSAAKEDEVWQKYGQSQVDATNKMADSAEAEAQKLRDQADTYGLTKSALDQLLVTRAQSTLALDREGLAMAQLNDVAPDVIANYEKMIDADQKLLKGRQDVLSAQQAVDVSQQNKKVQDDYVKTWQSTIDGIGTDFHNGFLQMLTDGKDGWSSFTASLKNTFETTVVDELYKAFAKPMIVSVIAQIAGIAGGSDVENQILQSNGMASSALGGVNNLSTAYSALTKSYGYLSGLLGVGYGSAGSAIGGAAGLFGASSIGAFGGLSTTGAAAAEAAGNAALSSSAVLGGLYGSATAGVGAASAAAGGSAASTAGAGAAGAASSASMAIPVVGWIMAGMAMSNSLMQSGWDPNNGSIDTTGKVLGSGILGVNSILKGIGLSDSFANIISGAAPLDRLFGRKDPEVTSSGVDGVITVADGFQGKDYADWYAKGGLFRSDARGTVNAPASQDQIGLINATVAGTVGTIAQLSDAIGGIDGLQGKLSQFQYAIRNDWSNQTNVTKSLTDLSNGLVDAVIPLEQYQQTGETLTQTAVRLTGVFTSTNTLADMLGKTMTQAFGDVGIAGANVRLNLVAAAGGIDSFNSEVSAYYSAYYSSAEQLSSAEDQMKRSFASLGLAMPQSKEAFRDLVSSLDLTTTAGQNTFASLMVLAPSFDQLSQAMTQAADAQQSLWNGYFSSIYTSDQQAAMSLKQLQAQFDALGVAMPKSNADFEALVENMDTSSQPMKDLQNALLALAPTFAQVTSAVDQAAAAAQEALGAAQKTAIGTLSTSAQGLLTDRSNAGSLLDSINGSITGDDTDTSGQISQLWSEMTSGVSLTQQIDLATQLNDLITKRYQTEQQAVSNLTEQSKQLLDYVQSLKAGDLSTETPSEKLADAAQQYADTLAKAQGGDQTAIGDLSGSADNYLKLAQTYYASSDTYTQIFDSVTSQISSFGDALQSQSASSDALAQQSLDQLQQLQQVVQSQYSQADSQYQGVVSQMAQQLSALDAIEQAAGVQSEVPSILKGLPTDLAAALAAILGTGVATGSDQISNLYQQELGRDGDDSGMAYWTGALANGSKTLDDFEYSADQEKINDLYQKVLGRAADASGLQYYTNQLFLGKETLDQIKADLQYAAVNGSHAGGADYIPFDGYRAELHKGEAVITSANNQKLSQLLSVDWSQYGRSSNDALIAEVRALREELKQHKDATVNATNENTTVLAAATQQSAHAISACMEKTADINQRAAMAKPTLK